MNPKIRQLINSDCWLEHVEKLAWYANLVQTQYRVNDSDLAASLRIIAGRLEVHDGKTAISGGECGNTINE